MNIKGSYTAVLLSVLALLSTLALPTRPMGYCSAGAPSDSLAALSVIGIDYSRDGSRQAIVHYSKSEHDEVFAEGDPIFGLGTVVSIEPTQVVIRENRCHGLKALHLTGGISSQDKHRYARTVASVFSAMAKGENFDSTFPWNELSFRNLGGVVRVNCPKDQSCYPLPEAVVNESPASFRDLDKLGARDVRGQGPNGIALGDVPPDSILGKIGIGSGFEIMRVNGRDVRSIGDLTRTLSTFEGTVRIMYKCPQGIMSNSVLLLSE